MHQQAEPKLYYGRLLFGLRVLVSSTDLGPTAGLLLLSDIGALADVGCPLLRGDGSSACSCCWPSRSAVNIESFSAALITKFSCLRFETSQTWIAQSPYLWPSYSIAQSQCSVTTNGHSGNVSWRQHPSGGHEHVLISVRQVRLSWCGTPSLKGGRLCMFHLLLGVISAVFLVFEFLRNLHHIFLSQIWYSPDLEGQTLVLVLGSRPGPCRENLPYLLCYLAAIKQVWLLNRYLSMAVFISFVLDA
jgi:hypothetical protein